MTKKEILIWVGVVTAIAVILFGLVTLGGGISDNGKGNGKPKLKDLITENDHTLGTKTAKVTLVEYSDFQCPACKIYHAPLQKVLEKYGDKIQFAFRHFPLPQHKLAPLASYYAEAAGKQNKFWEMGNVLYEKQEEWSILSEADAENKFIEYGKALGLDVEKLKTDSTLQEFKDRIVTDKASGSRAGLEWTPTFYLNGERMESSNSEEEFIQQIAEKLL
ncbi:MAG: thioredoxin domain-containing protein [bacterium]|nr:thioredoxin domain-containing protein [bacterium]